MTSNQALVIDKCIKNIKKTIVQFKQEEVGNRISNFSLAALEQVLLQELNILQEIAKEVEPCPSTPPEQSQ